MQYLLTFFFQKRLTRSPTTKRLFFSNNSKSTTSEGQSRSAELRWSRWQLTFLYILLESLKKRHIQSEMKWWCRWKSLIRPFLDSSKWDLNLSGRMLQQSELYKQHCCTVHYTSSSTCRYYIDFCNSNNLLLNFILFSSLFPRHFGCNMFWSAVPWVARFRNER